MKNLKMSCLLALLLSTTNLISAHTGSEGGGGGDANEMRVNEIRSDLLKWIEEDGAKSLHLPNDISLEEYEKKMSIYLDPLYVTVIFVEKDDPFNEELQVTVNERPKTCRGFFSREDDRPYILCNISRFQSTPQAYQYRIIHHEYAGLASLEKNIGDSSDYIISDQITDYLIPEKVLRMAVLKNPSSNFPNIEAKLITLPNIDGVFFTENSNENGVCKALGYENSAPGSALSVSVPYPEPLLRINDYGEVLDGDTGYKWKKIEKIICIKKIQRENFKVTKIDFPALGNGVGFAAKSSPDGVCKLLGHEYGVYRATFYKIIVERPEPLLIVDSKGTVIGGDNGKKWNKIKQITCITYNQL